MSHLILGDGVGVVDLVTENDEGNLGQLFHREEGVELSLGLSESLVVLGVDKEDDTVNLGEVVAPDTSGLLMTTQIESGEANVSNSKLLRCGVKSGLENGNTIVLYPSSVFISLRNPPPLSSNPVE
jgi:hypothetical protein